MKNAITHATATGTPTRRARVFGASFGGVGRGASKEGARRPFFFTMVELAAGLVAWRAALPPPRSLSEADGRVDGGMPRALYHDIAGCNDPVRSGLIDAFGCSSHRR